MCGIAGFFGSKQIKINSINSLKNLMKNRGPDNFDYFQKSLSNNNNICLIHSRLAIIDLEKRSNQPFIIGNYVIIFNGEIYNYVELREKLIAKGYKFETSSDTEVLLQYYILYGEDCVNYFEGMWSFAIFNLEKNELLLSRDRFGEKPLYFYKTNYGYYFASEIKFIETLIDKRLDINYRQIGNYLNNGYKSLNKGDITFYNHVTKIKSGINIKINNDLTINENKYFSPNYNPDKSLDSNSCIEEIQSLLINSLKLRIRSDVPLAFCLSGGIDSSSLVSIAAKKLNCNFKTFSILDSDERYNEKDNIDATVNDLNCNHEYIYLSNNNTIDNLKALINYHDAPVATISYFIQSFLYKEVSSQGYKVAISGSGADELFTGYYDHFLFHLYENRNDKDYDNYLKDWKKNIHGFIRNPLLKDPQLFMDNPKFRGHIFDSSSLLESYLLNLDKDNFSETFYCKDQLRNRMLNELFHETTQLILNEDDLNAMFYSIENRSPYLDYELFKFAYKIPSKLLINKGYGKFLLRESMKNILNDQVRLDRRKKGFNASINTMIDFNDKKTKEYLLDKDSRIFEFVDKDKIEKLFYLDSIPNHFSKFLFSFINTKIFLESKIL